MMYEGIKRYIVVNRITKEGMRVWAPSAYEACRQCGWLIGDCFVREDESTAGDARDFGFGVLEGK